MKVHRLSLKGVGNFSSTNMCDVKILCSMKRKIVAKISKEKKSLLIVMLLGDGTISSNYVFKLSHYKIRDNYTKKEFITMQQNPEVEDTLNE